MLALLLPGEPVVRPVASPVDEPDAPALCGPVAPGRLAALAVPDHLGVVQAPPVQQAAVPAVRAAGELVPPDPPAGDDRLALPAGRVEGDEPRPAALAPPSRPGQAARMARVGVATLRIT